MLHPNDQAPFPGELISLLERDRRDGHVTFCYPLACGHQTFVIGHLRELLEGSQRRPAKDCKRAIANAAEFVVRHHEILQEAHRQWSAHADACVAHHRARRAARDLCLSEI